MVTRERARRLGVAGLALAALAALGGVAWAADTIRASASCCTFAAPTYNMAAGEAPTFENAATDGVPHDVAANAKGPDGKFLFKSAVIDGGSTPVRGTQYLSPGTYRFFCTIHGSGMSADLVVGPGTPVERPSLTVSVTSSSIAAVRRAGKLLVRVRGAGSDARGATLSAKVGRTTIATKRGVSVPADTSRQLTMSLTRAGRAKLQGRERAAVAVRLEAEFAKAATARRLLD